MNHFYNIEIITVFDVRLVLDGLAAAYAETGRYDETISTAEKAHKTTLVKGPEILMQSLEKRLV